MPKGVRLPLIILTVAALLSGGAALAADAAGEAKPAGAAGQQSPHQEEINNGQDITRPLARFDARLQVDAIDRNFIMDLLTLRTDYPVQVPNNWILSFRVDLPIAYSNLPDLTSGKAAVKFRGGLSDGLFQAITGYIFNERVGMGGGAMLTFPTATDKAFGSGQYQVEPLFGVCVNIPEISNGTFVCPNVSYNTSYADRYAGLRRTSRLYPAPSMNFLLPKLWFITLYPGQEITYDFVQKAWFVPADAMVGVMVTKGVVVSLEVIAPLYNGDKYKPYLWKSEARIGFFY